MSTTHFTRFAARFAVALSLAGTLAACDNPVGHDEDHPEGVVVVNAQGQEVARYDGETRTATGSLTVAAGGTQSYRVFLTSHDDDRIPVTGGEYALGAPTVVIGTLASATLTGMDQLGVTGKAAGSTSVQLPVLHAGHEEFLASIPLTVTP